MYVHILLVVILLVLAYLYVFMGDSNTIVYRFYRPTCKFCVESKPEWDKFKEHMVDVDGIVIKEVNLDEGGTATKLAKKYDVSGVPTVFKINSDGTRVDHEGPRTFSSYMSFVISK